MSSSSFPSCFRPSAASDDHHTPPPLPPPPLPPSTAGKTNLTTCIYTTNLGIFSLTWSNTFLGHSLHLNLHPCYSSSPPFSLPNSLSSASLHFRLDFKLLAFWKKQGHKKLTAAGAPNLRIFWDFSRAKFGSVPEPVSGFYIAVVADGEMALLVGDLGKQAYSRTKTQKRKSQSLLLRREHLVGNKVYSTKAKFGGKSREISIDCRVNEDANLCISVDGERVLQIKRLKWKFRGNEKVEVDGVWVQVSWDVYNWLFDKDCSNGHAVFMFKFEDAEEEEVAGGFDEKHGGVLWQQQSSSPCGFGMSGTEWRKMRKSFLKSRRSSSSSSVSMSSASSGGGSSVLEWASSEESELGGPGSGSGFSLLVYAWKN